MQEIFKHLPTSSLSSPKDMRLGIVNLHQKLFGEFDSDLYWSNIVLNLHDAEIILETFL